MSFHNGSALGRTSPASSDGSSLQGGRARKTQDEALIKDKSFRRYAAGVDRTLSLFDTTLQEWADYISFLGRLLKALQSHPDGITVIASKFLVAKRLAQCLHPSLPSGVHQKALEVYDFIFVIIGTDGLAEDLGIYLPGLASTLTFASFSVRPLFLSLIEKHILKVPVPALRPALKSLILALLSGLEDESSDDFEKSLQTLHKIGSLFRATGRGEVFWQNLFLASITGHGRRPGVLAFLNKYLPDFRHANPEAIEVADDTRPISIELAEITTPEPGLLLRCFATGLLDEQSLVKRGFLDLLVTRLPLHAPIFSNEVAKDDLDLLISAAVRVVLRRDMSLNRRLWAWFLGPENFQSPKLDSSSTPSTVNPALSKNSEIEISRAQAYFKSFSAPRLITTLQSMIAHSSRVPSNMSRPYRVTLSLMDRWEIGNPVASAVFLPFMRHLLSYQKMALSSVEFQDVFRSANAFFDGVESIVIWSKMLDLALPAGKAEGDIVKDLDLAAFIIGNFKIEDEEMAVLHIPLVSLAMLESLSDSEQRKSSSAQYPFDTGLRLKALVVLRTFVEAISDRAFANPNRTGDVPKPTFGAGDAVNNIGNEIRAFYDHNQDPAKLSESPFPPESCGRKFFKLLLPMIVRQIRADPDGSLLQPQSQILFLLLARTRHNNDVDAITLLQELKRRLALEDGCFKLLPFDFLSASGTLLVELLARRPESHKDSDRAFGGAVLELIRHLWHYLSPSTPQYHVETFRIIIRLQHAVWEDEIVTSALSSLITQIGPPPVSATLNKDDVLERFATLWSLSCTESVTTFSTPRGSTERARTSVADQGVEAMAAFSAMLRHSMVSILSVLCGPRTDSKAKCCSWLQGMADLPSIFESITTEIKRYLSLSADAHASTAIDGLERANHMMEVLYEVVAVQSEEQWLGFSGRQDFSTLSLAYPEPEESGSSSLQISIMRFSCHILRSRQPVKDHKEGQVLQLHQSGLRLIRLLFARPNNESLLSLDLDRWIVQQLMISRDLGRGFYHSDLLDTLLLMLTAKNVLMNSREQQAKTLSKEKSLTQEGTSRSSQSYRSHGLTEVGDQDDEAISLPEQLLDCLLSGIAHSVSGNVIQKWIQVLCESINLYRSSQFRETLRIVEVLCSQINICFSGITSQFEKDSTLEEKFEFPLLCLLNGLDFVLARAHEGLVDEEMTLSTSKSPDLQSGFFGSMVSGTLSSEITNERNAMNNNRLTLMLCFQDALKTCTRLWSWQLAGFRDSSFRLASFQHSSKKIRGRSRKILEHLFAAEPTEVLEVLAHIWLEATVGKSMVRKTTAMDLVHTLEGSRPRVTIVALFTGVFSRTNPSALEVNQKSTLSTNLRERDLIAFLSAYTQSLEDDVLDEIWKDCTHFLRDVLSNPMPHRHILIRLVDFIAILSAKMDNTNASEELKMRKELRELFIRLLTAIFTIKPQSTSRGSVAGTPGTATTASEAGSETVEQLLDQSFSVFPSLLGESDRLVPVLTNVVSNIITPLFRSRQFPQNLDSTAISLLLKISRGPNTSKAWKREVIDAFGDPRFFSSALAVVKNGWLPLLRQLALTESILLPELQSRLSSPASAGIVFGVGATAARLEADKKTQLNLRRVACLLLAGDSDAFATDLPILQSKLEDLLTASATSSPSSTTRAEIFMVIRAICLVSSSNQLLARFWPMLNVEFRTAFHSLTDRHHHDPISPSPPGPGSGTYNNRSVLQACKLLDVLLLINLEDFQPQQWVLVTDTVDATYRPDNWAPHAIVDEVAQDLMQDDEPEAELTSALTSAQLQSPSHATPLDYNSSDRNLDHDLRRPWLSGDKTRACAEHEIRDQLLRPFFGQLSIDVYERTYSLGEADLEACRDDLLADLFDDRTFVGS